MPTLWVPVTMAMTNDEYDDEYEYDDEHDDEHEYDGEGGHVQGIELERRP